MRIDNCLITTITNPQNSCLLLSRAFIHSFNGDPSKVPSLSTSFLFHAASKSSKGGTTIGSRPHTLLCSFPTTKTSAGVEEEQEVDVEVADGYTITQFCDRMIDLFLNEKPRAKDWKKYLVFRDEWKKYSDRFYNRCQSRADAETNPQLKQKFVSLSRKVKRVDKEMEVHAELVKQIQDNPTDINVIVARRRKDFTDEFFRHLSLLWETNEGLEDRDAISRLGTRCLAAVSAFDNTLEIVDTFDTAQEKFNSILNSSSVEVACDKIKSLAKSKQLDSSLILLINSAWAAAKESSTMKNEVKDIMYHLYKTMKSSLRTIAPKEIKLLKYLLNITDPEDRFSALATAFSPGDEHQSKDPSAVYTTPKELHKWVTIMLDVYHLNKEETEMREVKQMNQPVVIERLMILKETIEEEYFECDYKTKTTAESEPDDSNSIFES
ncbi:uncharacterized protein At4g37920 [Impatiens glandulifera]|uniref:uncharacterized protein At4g37920 n=1 Tax=Impatiens glandulifera TaxID=253017 RepID=UPI001FB0E2AF|nr:uncharacterized protein At4g37920 [Impatiens glandulifera]